MKEKPTMPVQFIIGLILALGAGVAMYFGTFSVQVRIVVGIIGLLLIVTSKYKLL
ncbi:MAG: hypothetical protein KJO41_03385 [Bacteroidia bacterium]|nr:hypothetical protein [Bacteroidia bacterium]MBT8278020.1 hypothetical protein [Bacteroidia bacterium]NND26934.1 hypothetical protein [Flavobacteriaceae bacterium]NNK60367.1 hypothetical protein [Flavobacteriaceae bacterium]NNL33967.1 hypothetical protein [Flavobacteriaceae bacterium]